MDTLLLPPPLLQGNERSYAISNLWEGTRAKGNTPQERQLLNLVLPPWQRPAVWSESQQVRFVEGIFLGLGTGYYVINGRDWDEAGNDSPMSGWLIDGQQRITAIERFLKDEISVFDGIRYSDLSIGERRRRFDNMTFPCIELEYQADEEVLKELYRRLNFGGTPHTQADLALLSTSIATPAGQCPMDTAPAAVTMSAEEAMQKIQELLSGVEWNAGTLEDVAAVMERAGYHLEDLAD